MKCRDYGKRYALHIGLLKEKEEFWDKLNEVVESALTL